jgi:uncharacterized protein
MQRPTGYSTFASGQRPGWVALLLFLPARSVLLVFGQSLLAFFNRAHSHVSPWSDAGAWWTVWGSIADLGCLAILAAMTKREGIRFLDLIGPVPRWLLPKGIAYLLLIAPFSALGTFGAAYLVYGSWQAPMPVGVVVARVLPGWAVFYSLVVWAPIWSATEELTYNGYLAPRIASLSNRRWVPFVLVGFWWAAQHSFLPLVLDWRFVSWRFLAFVPGVVSLMVLYLRTQKLAPVIVAHWLLDVIAAATTLSLASLKN